jgi:radical SAM family uncharacterized protein/radical SAM-linked protein
VEELIALVSQPSRYLGDEVNSIKKDLSQVNLKVCLAFPDVYEIGMSHMGLQILYHLLNGRSDIAVERVYAPGLDMESIMRERSVPLTSLESALPLNNFDLVGFSLQYELSYTNILNMLDLSGIPLYASQRTEDYPLIIAGGPCAFNPEPLADFFDAFVIGDGEEALLEICDYVIKAKKEKINKNEVLNVLSQIEGVYIPSFFEVIYQESGIVKEIIPLKHGYERVKKRWVENLDKAPFMCSPIVPYKKIIHDRLNLEIARGCTRGCRFCQAGIIYRPVRERSMEKLVALAEASLKNSGYEEISLSSLSTGDHSQINQLLGRLMGRYASEKIAVSVPSLRSETLTPELIKEIKKVRKTGFTIAPEAGTQRLREVINKGITEKEILETVKNVFDAGWNVIKLYFMIGLPCEREEDLEGIIDLSRRVLSIARRGGKKRKVNVSVSTFVPKSHTPFQWEPQIGLEEMRDKQEFLKREIRRLHLTFKWQSIWMSYLEGIFARGDRRLSDAIVKAYHLGCRFDGWSEYLNYGWWEEALQNVDTDFYTTRRRCEDEVFPWDHIDCGVDRNFLWNEYQKGLKTQFTPDCRIEGCQRCGVCYDRKQHVHNTRDNEMASDCFEKKEDILANNNKCIQLPQKSNTYYKVRVQFAKLGKSRFLSHLELVTLFSRVIRRAGIPIRFSEGFHPLPKIVLGPALPVGVESISEYMDLEINGNINGSELVKEISRQLPNGFKILDLREIPLKFPSISDSIDKIEYSLSLEGPGSGFLKNSQDLRDKIRNFLKTKEKHIEVKRKSGVLRIDLREWVERLQLKDDTSLEMVLKMRGGRTVRPYEVLKGVLGLKEDEGKKVPVLKTGVHFKAGDIRAQIVKILNHEATKKKH